MNKRQAQRLLNIARALRESPMPKAFTMDCFVRGDRFDTVDEYEEKNWCGTPACALGHFGVRSDLQHHFKVIMLDRAFGDGTRKIPDLRYTNGNDFNYGEAKFQEYFGLTEDQAMELFSYHGCGGAKTPIQAARYIEKFVKEQYGPLI